MPLPDDALEPSAVESSDWVSCDVVPAESVPPVSSSEFAEVTSLLLSAFA